MNSYEKLYKRTIIIGFTLFLISILILNTINVDVNFSELENRKLEQKPQFSFNKLLFDDYNSDFEKYISDQFIGRNLWIGLKSSADRILGKKDSNGVFLGKDNYLIQKFSAPSEDVLDKKVREINSLATSLPSVNKYFMLVPNSTEILEEKLPDNAPVDEQLVYIHKVKVSLNDSIKFVSVYDTLYSKKNEYIFYKTDHHWTTKGAYYAYKRLAATLGITPNTEDYYNITDVTDNFYGSLYSKGNFRHIPPDYIEIYKPKRNENIKVEYVEENKTANTLYEMDNLNKKDKYTVFFNGNHPLIKITSNAGTHKKLLIIKDSYANSLVPFLTAHYDEIYMVDPRYYSEDIKELANSKGIDDLVILYNTISFFE